MDFRKIALYNDFACRGPFEPPDSETRSCSVSLGQDPIDLSIILPVYNEEGIITMSEFEAMLAEFAERPRLPMADAFTEISAKRFRSDADGRLSRSGAGRSYKHLPGRARDEVREWLFHVQKASSMHKEAARGR